MLLDKQNMFHDNVALAAGANNGDVIDMGAPTNLGALALGLGHGGEGAEIFTKIGTKGNADNTLAIVLSGADDAAMSVNVVAIYTLAATNIAAGGTRHDRIPHHTPKRFFRAVATTAGTTPAINNVRIALHTTANQRSLAGTGLI
jgi:hypothetical protein